VAVCGRSPAEIDQTACEMNERLGRAMAVSADVSDRAAVERMVSEVEAELGPIDLLVNNAGRMLPLGPLAGTDPDDWWQTLEVNLRGPLYCSYAVLQGMVSRGRGRIVNVSSGAGLAAIPMGSAYVVSKTALYRLTENLAAETSSQGVFTFAIDPGLVRSAMTEQLLTCGVPSIEHGFQRRFGDGVDVPPSVRRAWWRTWPRDRPTCFLDEP
jgi:NAD(P)-dependent dehydrogenase (short-subunit alcohol dehydrogenase family)